MTIYLRLLITLFWVFSLSASEIPNCDSPLVRLSRWPLQCQGKLPSKFDIPALEINFSDIEKIIQGAESSGGRRRPDLIDRTIGPMGMNFTTHHCRVRLLIDSQTRVSWLLGHELEVGETVIAIETRSWNAGLTNSLDPFADFYPASAFPKFALEKVSVAARGGDLILCYGEGLCAQTKQVVTQETQLVLRTLVNGLKLNLALSCTEL